VHGAPNLWSLLSLECVECLLPAALQRHLSSPTVLAGVPASPKGPCDRSRRAAAEQAAAEVAAQVMRRRPLRLHRCRRHCSHR
jgi:hypothetical protein